jgi:hypothetical protein
VLIGNDKSAHVGSGADIHFLDWFVAHLSNRANPYELNRYLLKRRYPNQCTSTVAHVT